MSTVLGLHGKVLVAGGAARVTSGRSCQKLPLCPTKLMLAKTDQPLAKGWLAAPLG